MCTPQNGHPWYPRICRTLCDIDSRKRAWTSAGSTGPWWYGSPTSSQPTFKRSAPAVVGVYRYGDKSG
ncbi:hypothetical protein Aglo01_28700 [Actinokineospora globicatena]|nr:hypothetical protein Aglo01_28700 [Actinokineospora globicatena]